MVKKKQASDDTDTKLEGSPSSTEGAGQAAAEGRVTEDVERPEVAGDDANAASSDPDADAQDTPPFSEKEAYIWTALIVGSVTGIGSFLIFPDWGLALGVTLFGGLLGMLSAFIGCSVPALFWFASKKNGSFAETIFIFMMMVFMIVIPLCLPIISNGQGPRVVAKEILASALSDDFQLSRDAEIIEKDVPDFVASTYAEQYGSFEETKFLMLKQASNYETVKGTSIALGCFKSGQWRMPFAVKFDMASKTVKFSSLEEQIRTPHDYDLACYKIAD